MDADASTCSHGGAGVSRLLGRLSAVWQFYVRVLAVARLTTPAVAEERARHVVLLAEVMTRGGLRTLERTEIATACRNLRTLLSTYDFAPVAELAAELM